MTTGLARARRPDAMASSPLGRKALSDSGDVAYRPRIILEMMFFWISLEPPKIDSLR
jgi:hypothetical protein